jgi:hypothetical protein
MVPVPLPEPTIGLATQVGRALWWAGSNLKATHEERRESALLLRRALVRAVCPDKAGEPLADRDVAIVRLEKRLAEMPVPGAPRPGTLAKLGRGLSRLNPNRPRGHFAVSEEIDGPRFADSLRLWVHGAADAREVVDALERVKCPGCPMDPENLGKRFPHALNVELKYAKPSTFRRELIKALWQHESIRAFMEEEFDLSERLLARAVPTAAAAGVAYGAAELADAGDPLLIGAGGAVAALLAALALIRPAPRPTARQLLGRDVARHWAADLLVALAEETPGVATEDLRARLVTTLTELERRKEDDAGEFAWPKGWRERLDPLLDHVKEEVIPLARDVGDERLLVILQQLRDLLLRAAAGRARWNDVLLAMLILVDETASPEHGKEARLG